MSENEKLIRRFENFKGYKRTIFDNKEWDECNSFIKGFNLAQKEFKTEEKYTKEDLEKAFNAGSAYATGSHKLLKQTHPNFKEWFNTIKK